MLELNQERYHRLLSHACREADFAYIGSVGNGPARGVFSGFSARAVATEVLQHPVPEDFCSDQLAQNMESLVHQFQIEQEPNPECLSGGWIGFLGYELGYVRENGKPSQRALPISGCSPDVCRILSLDCQS
jgi:para-aminobenzoate synthetase component 1